MKKIIIASVLLVLLVGCCKPQAAPCPRLPEPPRPELRSAKLPPDAPVEDVLRSYVLDLAEILGWGKQQQAIIKAHNESKPIETK